MNAALPNGKLGAGSSGDSVTTAGRVVSCVRNAKDKTTKDYKPEEIIESIRADKHWKLLHRIEDLRKKFNEVITETGDRKAARTAVAGAKKGLPGVLWSGRFAKRSKAGLLQHSGLLCADLDELGDKLSEVREQLLKSPYVWALFTSPSGDGLKCVFRVQADAEKHKASFRAVKKHVRELSGAEVDESCSDVSRLCFLSHDPDALINESATELPPLEEIEKYSPDATTGLAISQDPRKRRGVAATLLGDINWETELKGFCSCPGIHLHTTGDGDRDCQVCLDGAPTISCFHNHCSDIIEATNFTLRSRIGKVEQADGAHPVNDSERARRFAEQFANKIRHVQAWEKWLVWDGTRWAEDEDGNVFRKAQEMPKVFLHEAALIDDLDRRKKAAGLAIRAGDKNRLEAMIGVAKYQTGVAALPTLFDSDPWLLGVSNGVVDLRRGKFREACKEDYVTKQAGVSYDPAATCPNWEKFLSRVLGGNAELISFIRRAVGYSLTTEISEQCLFFLYGTGQNGKSTFVECLQELLGAYMTKATPALYTLNRHSKEPETEIARLFGKRLVTGSETEEGARLAESRVKDITGGDTLTGRFLYGTAFNFKPTHKLWIYGNHRPDIRGNDPGIWRRIKLIPFEVQIPDEEKDPGLLRKLLAEMPGILNWAIRGCLDWQEKGLEIPQSVLEATAEYREEEDIIGEFIGDECLLKDRVERWRLYQSYNSWAAAQGTKLPLTSKSFAKRLRVRDGIGETKSGGKRYWTGITLSEQTPTISFRNAKGT